VSAPDNGYEAQVWSANLPNRIIAFIMPERGVPFGGGIFRIQRVRTATEADEKAFPRPPDGICPLCGQAEPE
jgi:hypothetical protein